MLLVCGIWTDSGSCPLSQRIKRKGPGGCRLTGDFIHSETEALITLNTLTKLTVGHTSEYIPGLQLLLGILFVWFERSYSLVVKGHKMSNFLF